MKKSIKLKSAVSLLSILILLAGSMECSRQEKEQTPSPAQTFTEPARIVGIGRIEPELRLLELSAERSGLIIFLHFQPGDEVSRGQVIIELNHKIEEAKLEQAKARLQTQLSEIEGTKASLAAMKIKAENAKAIYARAKILYEKDAQTESYFDNARTEYESLLEEIKGLEASVAAAQDAVRQIQADRKLAQAELDQRFIMAPMDGQILSLDVTIGSFVSAGTAIGTFAPRSPRCARCEIDELFAEYAKTGQKAFIRYPGMTETIAEGTVTFAGPYLRQKSLFSDEVGDLEDRRVREIVIRLVPDATILYGSRVECVIVINQ